MKVIRFFVRVLPHLTGMITTDLYRMFFLRMMDGDVIEFGYENNKKEPLVIDCSNVSVVLLGAFEELMDSIYANTGSIGFGSPEHKERTYDNTERIVSLNPLTVDDYEQILTGPILADMQAPGNYSVQIDNESVKLLAQQAVEKNLGVRWMRSQIANNIDDQMFAGHRREVYNVKIAA